MFNYSLTVTILKIATLFWALLVMAVDAAFIAKFNSYVWYGQTGSGFSASNAVIACAIFTMVYLGVALYFIFFVPAHVLISVMVDTICIGFLFIFAIGSVGALSSYVGWWGNFTGTSTLGSLLDATVGLGWVMVFLLLAILLIEVIVTLVNYGGSLDTWKTPFNELLVGSGGSLRGARGTKVESGVGAPAMQQAQAPAPVTSAV
ncbi:hypothetical protein JCM24511_06775 [Saitozyma sp. JCM 24511]|nr:hypothetical protein JCM24511_06775 [Saitozyma sp. JCM 24511]